MAVPDAELWAFDLARVRLVYGERLRRAKETAAARPQLAAALDAFERLGAQPWAQRAANELRATGITVGRAKVTEPEALSPQQLEIARLAATGLSNKEIGERMFLSHRPLARTSTKSFQSLGSAHVPRSGTLSRAKPPTPRYAVSFRPDAREAHLSASRL